METSRLIEVLGRDGAAGAASMRRVWVAALAAAIALAAVVFFPTIGPRPDFMAAAGTLRFLFKFVVTLSLLATALWALSALARPGQSSRWLYLLAIPPALLLLAAVAEMMVVPAGQLRMLWEGKNALVCLTWIPLIGLGPLVAFIVGLRQGAPTNPGFAGAVAGLVAGGVAATFYAAHCTDDSPLFVATWYTIAIAGLALLGALGGRLVARW
ncbi:MAG: NrsF family protein [Rhizobiaceae bacterium]